MAFNLCDKGFLQKLFVQQFFSDFPEPPHLVDSLHVTLLIGFQTSLQLIHLFIVILDVISRSILDELVLAVQLSVLGLSIDLEVC